jgi:hypothetical protein
MSRYNNIPPKLVQVMQGVVNADRAFGRGNIVLTQQIVENTIELLEEIKELLEEK